MRQRSWHSHAAGTAVLAVVLSFGGTDLFAQTGAGMYSAPSLKIPVGARLMASPDVVAGMRPDASLMYSNPAFLSTLDHAEIFVSSSRWLDELSFNAIGAAIPIMGEGTVLGIGTTLLYSGGLQGYDDAMNVVAEESFYELGLDLALSHRFGSTGLSGAVGATYVREHVAPADGSGYAFHLGASYWRGANVIHAALRDLGGSVNYASESWPIASEQMAGVGRIFDSSVGRFFAGLQASTSDGYGSRVRLGVDYAINSMFTLRTGLHESLDEAQSDAPFNGGFGMHYGAFALEYAYTPQEYFASAHTFSLAYRFGAPVAGAPQGAIVPAGDLAPPAPEAEEAPPRVVSRHTASNAFLLVGGSHSWLESARSEARALELLKIPAEVENEGTRFRVVVGRFATFDDADRARTLYAGRGHVFQILAR